MENFKDIFEKNISAEDVEYFYQVVDQAKKDKLSKKEVKAKLKAAGAPSDIIADLTQLIRQGYKIMENFREMFLEAEPLRAWNNKLKSIDDLMSWMYDKDILNKGEKSDKDRIFRQYYRYYNDGDFP